MPEAATAWSLIAGADPALLQIVRLSLGVSLAATLLAALVALPAGALLALVREAICARTAAG